MKDTLLDGLTSFSMSDTCPMHMPGHKRRTDVLGTALPYGLDITEIHGFDDLHSRLWDACEDGYLHDLSAKAAALYGCSYAFPLVGGSTVGVLAAVRAVAMKTGCDEAILARNCHKSVYHAVELNRMTPHFIYPTETVLGVGGAVTPEKVCSLMEAYPACRLVILTSPTYEGVISPVADIGRVVHEHGGYLLVDAAHGAHLPFVGHTSSFEGADLAVVSLHKTLPALTQTALLLGCSDRVEPWRLARELGVFETSSPSYPLMASVETCLDWVLAHAEDFAAYNAAVSDLRTALRAMKYLSLFETDGGYDGGKIVIGTRGTGLTGSQLATVLREQYHIEVEMAAPAYVIAMTSVCDTLPGAESAPTPFERLKYALLAIDGQAGKADAPWMPDHAVPRPERVCQADEALRIWDGHTYCSLGDARGRVAACYLWAYPPGVPLIIPGERLDADVVSSLLDYERTGIRVRCVGGDGGLPDRIPVLTE